MSKIKNIVCILFFAIFTLTFGAACIFKEPIQILVSERRKAAQFPELSAESIMNKSFFDGLEAYLADQFPLRDEFRELKAVIQMKLLGQKDNDGVYLAHGHISELQTTLNESSVQKTAKKINSIREKYLDGRNTNVYCSVIPDKNYYLAAANGYPSLDYGKMIEIFATNLEGVEYIDIFDCLDAESYYKTDSHWKQERLNAVVERISQKMNFIAKPVSEYTAEELSDFEGVYASRLAFGYEKDKIIALTDEITQSAKVSDIERGEDYTGVYNKSKLKSYDKYDVFLSGASALITVENPLAKEKRELVIFRDSFGSSLAPLLLSGYSKITLADIRYMSSQILDEYISFENCDILFIYNTQILNQSSVLK